MQATYIWTIIGLTIVLAAGYGIYMVVFRGGVILPEFLVDSFCKISGRMFCPDDSIARLSTEDLVSAINYMCENPSTDLKTDFIDCKHDVKGNPKCNVNFYLPQGHTNIDDWIPAEGDPYFLVYYQSFPQGEEVAWTEYHSIPFNWVVIDVALDAVSAVAFTTQYLKAIQSAKGIQDVTIVGNTISGGTTQVIDDTTKAALEKALNEGDLTTYNNILTAMGESPVDEIISFSQIAAKTPMVITMGQSETSSMKSVLSSLVSSKLSAFKDKLGSGLTVIGKYIRPKAVKIWGEAILLASAKDQATLITEFYWSKMVKYTSCGENSLCLFMPFHDPKPYPLSPKCVDKNLQYLQLQKRWYQNPPFYLASPCYGQLEITLANCGATCDKKKEFVAGENNLWRCSENIVYESKKPICDPAAGITTDCCNTLEFQNPASTNYFDDTTCGWQTHYTQSQLEHNCINIQPLATTPKGAENFCYSPPPFFGDVAKGTAVAKTGTSLTMSVCGIAAIVTGVTGGTLGPFAAGACAGAAVIDAIATVTNWVANEAAVWPHGYLDQLPQ